jgi:hypothetical protein
MKMTTDIDQFSDVEQLAALTQLSSCDDEIGFVGESKELHSSAWRVGPPGDAF